MSNKNYTINGKLISTNYKPLSGLKIEAWDKDLIFNDFIGEAISDKNGKFKIVFTQDRFKELFLDANPDIFFKIYLNDELIHSTEDVVTWNCKDENNSLEIIIDTKQNTTNDSTETTSENKLLSGSVKHANGNAIANIQVNLSEQLLRDKKLIATTITLNNGTYSFPAFTTKSNSVVIDVIDSNGNTIATSGPIYIGATKTTYDLKVDDTNYKGNSAFQNKIPLLKNYFTQLKNDPSQKPLSVEDVYFVANSVGNEPQDTFHWLRANEMEAKTSITAEAFYGLYKQGLPTNPNALTAISPNDIEKAIQQAAENSMVSDELVKNSKEIVAKWNDYIVNQALEEIPKNMNASLSELLSIAIADKKNHQKLVKAYVSHEGSIEEFWNKADEITGVKGSSSKVQNVLKLSSLTGNHTAIVDALMSQYKDSKNIFHDIAGLNQSDWESFIKNVATKTKKSAVPDFIVAKTEDERVALYAKSLDNKIAITLPTHSFFGKLSNQSSDNTAFSKTKEELVTFFKNNPAFDLKKSDTLSIASADSKYDFKNISDKNLLASELQSIQRLSAYTTDFNTMSYMKKEGYDSAGDIITVSQNQFIVQNAEKIGSVQEAKIMYEKAELNYMYTATIWAKAHPNLTFKTATTPAPISEPTLRTMFGTLDSCECEHCTSVFSPAAYYTDILNFLYSRSPVVYNELIRRRPDLINIELTCDNTNTPLPYVDLVNELLENFILKNNGIALPDTYQTTWQAGDLAANPEHINYTAYDKLKAEVYPRVLPFNLPVEEARVYLKHLSIERHQLMNTFYPGTKLQAFNDFYLAMERMGFNKQEADILTGDTTGFGATADTGLWNFYGFNKANGYKALPDPADSSLQITGGDWNNKLTTRVDVFLQQTGLLYKEMLSLLICSTINPVINHDADGNEIRTITIVATNGDNDTCELDHLSLNGVTTNHLQQIHRFIRLWQKLGWNIFDVDKACLALELTFLKPVAQNKIDLLKLSQANYFLEHFHLSIESTLALWDDIGTITYTDYFKDNYPPIISLYDKLFLNKSVINPVDAAFEDASALVGNLDDHTATIIAALQISDEDYTLLKDNLAITTLTLTNLSLLYRNALLAKKLKLSIEDFNTLKTVLGVSPFGNPANTFLFLEKNATVSSSGFSIAQIDYLINHNYTAESSVAPTDETISVFLTELRGALRSLDSNATTESKQSTIAQKISEKLSISATAADMLVNKYVKGITDNTKVVSNDFITTSNFLKTYTDNSDPANPKDYEPIFVRTITTPDVTLDAENNLFNDYMRLEKMATIINKLKLSDTDLEFILKYFVELSATNIANLPITTVVGDYNKFEALINLIKARDAMPIGTPDFMDIMLNTISTPDKNLWLTNIVTRTNWDRTTLEALVGNAATVNNAGLLKTNFPADFRYGMLTLKIKSSLAAITLTGLSTDIIIEAVKNDFTSDISTAIKNTAKGKYDEAQWNKLAKPLRNQLREKQRQALVAYAVAHPNYDGVTHFERWKDSDELYEYLLIDVEMKPISMTSRIKQAICSVQLFIDRVLLNLEHANCKPTTSPLKLDGDQVEEWKEWRKIYRIWEANRKIFLYPENWIEPELRDDKSPFFKELETQLKQNELNDYNVEDAFHVYLDKLDEVARLEVVAMYHQIEKDIPDEDDIDILHVIARTPIDPHHYYHRTLENGEWSSWFKMEIDVDGNHIVFTIFNRKLCLFWVFFTQDSEETEDMSDPVPKYWKMQAAWSEFRKNKWTAKRLSKEFLKSRSFEKRADLENFKTKLVLRHWIDEEDNELAEPNFDGKLHLFLATDNICYIDNEEVYSASFLFENTNTDPDLINEYMFNSFILPANTSNNEQIVKSNVTGNELTVISPVYSTTSTGGMFGRAVLYPLLEDTPNGRFKLVIPTNEETPYMKHFFFQDKYNSFYVTHTTKMILDFTKPDYSFGDWIDDSIIIWDEFQPILDPAEPITNPGDLYTDPFPDDYFGVGYNPNIRDEIINQAGPKTIELNNATVVLKGKTNTNINNEVLYTMNQPMMYRASKGTSFKAKKLAKSKPTNSNVLEYNYNNQINNYEPVSTGLYVYQKYKLVDQFTFTTFYHQHVKTFKKELYKNGIEGMLKRAVETQPDTINFEDTYLPTSSVTTPYPTNEVDFTYGSAYSQYNWELFFHVPMLVACRLKDDQRFEEARNWFHYIFDPTQSEGGDKERFWQFKPFYDEAGTAIETLDELLQNETELNAQVEKWMKDPFKPHVIARMRISAYMKNVVMKYLDNLIAWADNLFKRDTIEAINEATNLYIMAANILGPRPQEIPPRAQHDDATFDEIKDLLDDFSNAMVNIETMISPSTGSGGVITGGSSGALGKMFYFCVPRNEFLMKYWDIVADRLFKIRNSMNIQGVVRTLPLFEPPIDPAMLVRAAAAGMDLSSILSDMNAALPNYRFSFMLQKAIEFSNDVKGLGAALLQALEKRDAESFALLRSTHEQNILNATLTIKEKQVDDAKAQLESIQKTKENIQIKYDYYNSRPYMNAQEKQQLDSIQIGLLFSVIQGELNTIGGVLSAIPNLKIGAPTSMGATWGGDNLGAIMNAISTYMGIFAAINNAQGSMAGTLGSYTRRRDDWQFQAKSAAVELQQIEKQILSSEIKIAIAEKDLLNQKLQIENSLEADDFMRSKFTNQELYDWMIGQLATVYFQSYQLAFDLAKKAEQCYQYELGEFGTSSFIQFGYWDSLKKGLLSAEKLQYDLRRMESAYYDLNNRDLEITKHVSLLLLNPQSIIDLRNNGTSTFIIPEEVFDLDFPGHYLRRIKTVTVNIPCIAGPYTSISATLRLLKHTTRLKTSSGTYSSADYAADNRFRHITTETHSIATSNAQNDSGVFELNFRDERYLPFEGCGVFGEWQLELNSDKLLRMFDYNTISDVIVTIRYTALEDNGTFKNDVRTYLKALIASTVAPTYSQSGLTLNRMFSLRHEYGTEWHKMFHPLPGGTQTMNFKIQKDQFPYFAQNRNVSFAKIHIYGFFTTTDDYTVTIKSNNGANVVLALTTANSYQLANSGSLPGNFGIGDFTLTVTKAGPIDAPEAEVKDIILVVDYNLTV